MASLPVSIFNHEAHPVDSDRILVAGGAFDGMSRFNNAKLYMYTKSTSK